MSKKPTSALDCQVQNEGEIIIHSLIVEIGFGIVSDSKGSIENGCF